MPRPAGYGNAAALMLVALWAAATSAQDKGAPATSVPPPGPPPIAAATDKPAPIQRLIAEGARGVSNGRGFYNYSPETAKQADELFHAHAWQARALMDRYFPIEEK